MGQLVFQATLGGQVNLVGPNTASTYNINVPAVAGNMVTTGDTGTVSSTMLASSLSLTTPNINVATGTSLKVSAGFYSTSSSSFTYTDGIVMDYTTGFGRISVGTSDGLAFYNAGVATTELMRLESAGNLDIGTTYGGGRLNVTTGSQGADGAYATYKGTIVINEAGASSLQTTGGLEFKASVFGSGYGAKLQSTDNGSLMIGYRNNSASWTETARFDSSGNLLVGTTITNLYAQTSGKGLCYRNSASLDVLTSGDNCVILNRTTSLGQIQEFRYNGTAVGSISYNGSLTLYNATSDQRLKENIVDAETALAKVGQIKIRAFDWIESKTHETHGVIAQELQQVVPQCVTEGLDNEDGSIKHPWQVDTSPLIPMLIKAIQEQQAIIEQLRADVETLKAPQ